MYHINGPNIPTRIPCREHMGCVYMRNRRWRSEWRWNHVPWCPHVKTILLRPLGCKPGPPGGLQKTGPWKWRFRGGHLKFRSNMIQKYQGHFRDQFFQHQSALGKRPSWRLQDHWLKCRVPARWSANDLPSTSEWPERFAARSDSPVPSDPCPTSQSSPDSFTHGWTATR